MDTSIAQNVLPPLSPIATSASLRDKAYAALKQMITEADIYARLVADVRDAGYDLAEGTVEQTLARNFSIQLQAVGLVGAARVQQDMFLHAATPPKLPDHGIQHGVPQLFFNLFITLNIFIGIFNLLPLLPLDGGHLAIAWFEKVRSWLYARLRKPDPGRVDYYKLMPITYAVILIGGAFTLLTVTADIVNPIQIFSR